MDDGGGVPVRTAGEAAPLYPEVIIHGDLVKFRSTTAHGDRGIAMVAPDDFSLRVQCADGTVVTPAPEDHLTVIDRGCSMFLGQHVTAASDPAGQAGVVTAVATELDLILAAAVVARGVSPGELRRVRELSLGDWVVSGPWLGRVVKVYLDVDVRFDDGSVCRVPRATDGGGDNKYNNLAAAQGVQWRCDPVNSPYYPGQRVVPNGGGGRLRRSAVFQNSQWLSGSWNRGRREGTVVRVEMAGAVVCWVASARLGKERRRVRASAPPAYQPDANGLTVLPSDAAGPWGVADRCFFRSPRGRRTSAAGDVGADQFEFEPPMCVADARTAVDVLWQDGTRRRGVPSASLLPFAALNDHDFLPGERVVDLAPPPPLLEDGDSNGGGGGTSAATDEPAVVRTGVVRSVDSKNQTVRVLWLKPAAASEEASSCEVECHDETVSAYNLGCDYDHHVSYGWVVIRKLGSPDDGDHGESIQVPSPPAQPDKEATGANDLSWVGHVIDLCEDGYVQVKWGNGTMSKVLPHEITWVEQLDVAELEQELQNWNQQAEEGTPQDPDAANADIDTTGNEGEEDDDSADRSNDENSDGGAADGNGSVVEVQAAADPSCSDDSHGFPQFDVVHSPPDHNYLDGMEEGARAGRSWMKRVQKEWEILKNNLPDTIYARAFEDRMDLLRVAMVGAAGTPYQDGLFFFDLQLPPSSYPAAPPLVHYRSFGLRVNPNLYASGTVCLSLLGTFGGNGAAELWSPATSSILQVVVSIQGLVLTEQPYYNEPGYEAQLGKPEGARNALPYAENAYILTLWTVLHLLRRPPAGFEALVEGHFRRRGRSVLRACAAYLHERRPVGTLDDAAGAWGAARRKGDRERRQCSEGFRLALAGVVPQLVKAFTMIGADGCEHFEWSAPSGRIRTRGMIHRAITRLVPSDTVGLCFAVIFVLVAVIASFLWTWT